MISPDRDAVADLLDKIKDARAAHLSGGVIAGLSARERRLLERLMATDEATLAVAIEGQR